MHLRLIDYVLWLAAPTLQLGVLVAMYRRGLHRDYPYFFNYTILQVANEPILFLMNRQSYTLYYFGYWVSIALSALVSFAVLQEIFKNAFRPYEALRDLSVILFRWSALVILLVAGMWAISSSHSDQGDAVRNTIFLASRSVRLMQCGLIFFLLLFSEYLGLSRRSLLFGIALGFGLFASVSMLVATALSHQTFVHVSILRWINTAAYDLAVIIWLGYSVLSPSRSSVAAATVRSEEWNSALEDARVPVGADSLLDSMDRTVERLLYPQEEVKANLPASTRP
jgi:hypothetical protein